MSGTGWSLPWSHRRRALALIACGAALHAYALPSIGWFLWGMLPYGWCVLALVLRSRGRSAMWGAAMALGWDLVTHVGIFVFSESSTASIGLLFVPLWSGGLWVPVTMAATSGVFAREYGESEEPRDQR